MTARVCRGCGQPLALTAHGRRVWCSERCRKSKYAGQCLDCGAPTSGTAFGKSRTPRRCSACAQAHAGRIAREYVIDSIAEWNELYGQPPSATDWNLSQARHLASPARLAAIESAHKMRPWPSVSNVAALFGSWREALIAAGFEPRPPGRPPARVAA